jgi:hypothetical protein
MSQHLDIAPARVEQAVDALVDKLSANSTLESMLGDEGTAGVWARELPVNGPTGQDVRIRVIRPARGEPTAWESGNRREHFQIMAETKRVATDDNPHLRLELVQIQIWEVLKQASMELTGVNQWLPIYRVSEPSSVMWDDDKKVYFNTSTYGSVFRRIAA